MIEGLSDSDIHSTRLLLKDMARNVQAEVPYRLHEATGGGLGAAPPFTDAFNSYVGFLTCKDDTCKECRTAKQQPRQVIESDSYRTQHRSNRSNRTTKALRKLRRVAPLEFDVLYMVLMQGLTIGQVVGRLNERAAQRGLDEHFDQESVTILVVTGSGKLKDYY